MLLSMLLAIFFGKLSS